MTVVFFKGCKKPE